MLNIKDNQQEKHCFSVIPTAYIYYFTPQHVVTISHKELK